MTFEDRVRAVADFGFTARQARFLVTVMLHAGVCLPRQYAAFAGIVHGQKTRLFFAKLVHRRYAAAYRCRHHRGRIYQVHHKALYRAIGQTDSRHRRPLSPARVVRGLMLMDAVLADPTVIWLTDQDAAAGLTERPPIDLNRRSHLGIGAPSDARRRVAEQLPVGLDATGRVILLYLATDSEVGPCHAFVDRYLERLRDLPAWTLRIVVPPWPSGLGEFYAKAVTEEFTATLRPAWLSDLRRHFAERRQVDAGAGTPPDPEHFDQAEQAFRAPRYQRLYRRWLIDGDRVFDLAAEGLKPAIESGAGRIETVILPHRYGHLEPLVNATTRKTQGPRP